MRQGASPIAIKNAMLSLDNRFAEHEKSDNARLSDIQQSLTRSEARNDARHAVLEGAFASLKSDFKELKERLKLTVLMAEQNFHQAVRIADRGYVIVHGKIEFQGGSADELNNNDLIRKFYLGL